MEVVQPIPEEMGAMEAMETMGAMEAMGAIDAIEPTEPVLTRFTWSQKRDIVPEDIPEKLGFKIEGEISRARMDVGCLIGLGDVKVTARIGASMFTFDVEPMFHSLCGWTPFKYYTAATNATKNIIAPTDDRNEAFAWYLVGIQRKTIAMTVLSIIEHYAPAASLVPSKTACLHLLCLLLKQANGSSVIMIWENLSKAYTIISNEYKIMVDMALLIAISRFMADLHALADYLIALGPCDETRAQIQALKKKACQIDVLARNTDLESAITEMAEALN